MAQGMVTDFFTTKKRSDPFQASKRRKVLRANAEGKQKISVAGLDDFKAVDEAGESSTISKLNLKQNSEGLATAQFCFSLKTVEPVLTASTSQSKSETKTSTSANTKRRTTTRSRASTRKKSVNHGPMDKMLARAKNKSDSSSTSEESVTSEDSEVTSVSDDHDVALPKSLPGTPTKRSQNSEAPIRRKRRKPVLSDDVAPEKSNDTITETEITQETVSKTRQKKSANSKASAAKKSLDKTFQKYENKEKMSQPVKKEKDETELPQEPVSNNRRKVQSKDNPTKVETKQGSSSRSKSKRTIQNDSQPTASVDSGPKPEEKAAASNPLGDRIRATLQEQKSPVKQEMPASTIKATKGKLTPAMVKERLAKSGKLAELQSRLAQIKECANQAKKEAKVDTKKVTKKEKEKPKSSSVPAYEKYHSLASPAPTSLALPFKYKTLEQMFHSVDTVVSLLHNRKETCTFPKLKSAVQEMCRKTFELRNVGQIKTVYPTSYFFNQQKQTTKQRMSSKPTDPSYELAIQPNIDSDGMSSNANDTSDVSSQAMQGTVTNLMKKFTPSMLIARRTIFHNSLIDIVKEHHKEFLTKLDRPLTVPDDKLTRWHPKFPLDTIAEVEPSPLPEPPFVKTYSNARDVLDKARDMMTPRVAKALETVAKNSELLKSAKAKPSSTSTLAKLAPKSSTGQGSSQGSSAGLQGINQSLLERIRAKEAQKQISGMMRDPEDEKRIARLERLPELCRIVRVYFLAEKKCALTYDLIVKKLGDSAKSSLSKPECEKHLDLMIEILPTWLTVHNIRREKYIKMNKTQDINDITAKVNKIYKESK